MKIYILLLTLVVGSQAIFKPGVGPIDEAFEDDDDDPFADDHVVEFALETTTNIPSKAAPPLQKCGMRKEHLLFRAGQVHSYKARFGEFNWAVPIFEVLWDGVQNYTCVGSLIHPQVVLTVAHYFHQKKNWVVRAGDWNITAAGEFYKHQTIYVSSVNIHPNFNKKNLKFDVALLFLTSPVNPAPHIGFTCLPPAGAVTPSNAECIVTGWGTSQFENGQLADVMKMVDVPFVSKEDCQEKLRGRLGQAFNLHKTWVCAGGVAGKDACLRDGGGPLVCPYVNSKDQYYQAGIVSWGHNCGLEDVPGVYTNVAELRQWIDDRMTANNFTIDSYTP